MHKVTKKLICILTAGALAAGVCSLAACGSGFKPVAAPDNSGGVESNGGFVVATNDYYYFINGVELYTSDNTYGDVVKGSLMRISKSDAESGKNTAEMIIPSLMVAADYTSGLYIYGDRIYYATPNNVKNTSSEIERDYLDFKSAKLDGTDIKHYFRVSDNSTTYRFVEAGEGNSAAVYLMYVDGSSLRSYNTVTKKETELVNGASAYIFNSDDKSDPTVYYAMGVTYAQDKYAPITEKYNQIYRVSADATEVPDGYEYEWDEEWLNDNDVPYTNLGEIVLDGIGSFNTVTMYNHDAKEGEEDGRTPEGYTYVVRAYENDGLYFTRARTNVSDADLYYMPISEIGGEYNSITLNNSDVLDMVADSTNTDNASTSALYYIDSDGGHHYLYVSGEYIYRADVTEKGRADALGIAYDASGAELISIDTTSDETYDYVYYSRANGNGKSVERAVINGEKDNYSNLQFEDEDNSAYEPVALLNVQHASSWYNYEIIDNILFYANVETVGGASYDYIYTVNLKNADGSLMDNTQIEELNEKYNSIFDEDKKVGYLEKVKETVGENYPDALTYYFYTGETELFWENIEEAVRLGKKNTYLYNETEQNAFREFTEYEYKAGDDAEAAQFYDENGENYFSYNYFVKRIGEQSESDIKAQADYWKNTGLKIYVEEEEEPEGLAWWGWLLIAIAIAVVVAAAIVTPLVIIKKRKEADEGPKVERLKVDTTDDRNLDVYNMNGESGNVAEEPADEPADEPAEESAEEPAEEPAEEAAEAAEETPSEEIEEAAEEEQNPEE